MASTTIGGTTANITSGPWLSTSGDRKFPDALFESMITALGGGQGVIRNTGATGDSTLRVDASSPASMQVVVKAGAAVLGPVDGGHRVARVTSDQSTQIGTADTSNPRIDVVGLMVRDSSFTDANNGRAVENYVLAGTAASSPSAPTFTNSTTQHFLPLAEVRVAANATSISATNITDVRNTVGGISNQWYTGATFPSANEGDLFIFDQDVTSGLSWRDTDGVTTLTSAKQGDIARYNGTNWVKEFNNAASLDNLPVSVWDFTASAAMRGMTTIGDDFYAMYDPSGVSSSRVYKFDNSGFPRTYWTPSAVNTVVADEGITTDGTNLYLLNTNTSNQWNLVLCYTPAGVNVSSSNFTLNSANQHGVSIVFANNKLWVVDGTDYKVYAYTTAGARSASDDFSLDSQQREPLDIVFALGKFWIGDAGDDKVYCYNANGTRSASDDFDVLGDPYGLAYHGGRFYVSNSNGQVKAYRSDGTR